MILKVMPQANLPKLSLGYAFLVMIDAVAIARGGESHYRRNRFLSKKWDVTARAL